MLAFVVSMHRQLDGGASPATMDSPTGEFLAVWSPELLDHRWIQGVISAANGIDLGGNGYPFRLTAKAEQLLPILKEEPPEKMDEAAVARCHPDEWLLIEVWDQS